MPPKGKGKRKGKVRIATRKNSGSRKRKKSSSSSSVARSRKKRKSSSSSSEGRIHRSQGKRRKTSSPPPKEQTEVDGPLEGNLFLLTDRLKRVQKLDGDDDFHESFEPELDGNLGEGTFGNVSRYRYKATNKVYAVKIVNKDQVLREYSMPSLKLSMYCEAACFTEILPKHKHVIHVRSVCESPSYVYYVMEHLSKFDLSTSYRSYTSAEARRCFYRILQGLDHLHKHGVVHGDMKMDNICLRKSDKTDPVIIDFGWCNYNSRRALEKKDSFKEAEIFTQSELKRMRRKHRYQGEDIKELPEILELFLTGEPELRDISKPGYPRFPPKRDTDSDAVALLDFMNNEKNLRSSSVAQLMEHCWFVPERELADTDDRK